MVVYLFDSGWAKKKFWRAALGSEELRLREMDTTDDNKRADDKSRRRGSLEGLPKDLGQDLPEAPPRTKCDNPAVAITVKVSQQKHRDAIFNSPNSQAASNARAATTKTFKGVDWSDYLQEGDEILGIVDAPPTKKRPTAKTPPVAGPKARDSARRAAPRPFGKSPPKVSED